MSCMASKNGHLEVEQRIQIAVSRTLAFSMTDLASTCVVYGEEYEEKCKL